MHHQLSTEPILATPQPPLERRGADIPAMFEHARAVFEAARAAYKAREYPRAADGFLEAAAILVATGPYADDAGASRSQLFLDAAYAWQMAGMASTGRATLARLRKDGRATDAELEPARAALR